MNNYIPKPSKFDPDENGHFGIYGGRYVPETLMPILLELEESYNKYRFDKDFWNEVNYLLKDYVGRPSPLYYAENISKEIGAKIYLKSVWDSSICFRNKKGVKNLIKGARAKMIPMSVGVYPISCNTFGKNITYTPTVAK